MKGKINKKKAAEFYKIAISLETCVIDKNFKPSDFFYSIADKNRDDSSRTIEAIFTDDSLGLEDNTTELSGDGS